MPAFLASFGQAHRGLVIDLVGHRRVEVAQGIIGEAGQMDDRVDAFDIGRLDVTDILSDGRRAIEGGQRAFPKQGRYRTP